MSCTDCQGGVPSKLWKRCVTCAMARLRHLMSGGLVPLLVRQRQFSRSGRVTVVGRGDGIVRRVQGDKYTIELDGGERCYVQAVDLSEVMP